MEQGKILPPECKMVEVESNDSVNNDCPFLMDEKFDFDLSLSPSSDHEDEVFVGPVGHKEKCIAVSLEAHEQTGDNIPPAPAGEVTWSPLAGEKYVEIFKEAHLVAIQLQSGSKPKRNHTDQQEEQKTTEIFDKFVRESKLKEKILEKGIEMEKTPRMVKRETYCVWESPLCQLLPSFQKHSSQPVTEIGNSHSPQMPINASSPGMNKLTKIALTPLVQGHSPKNNKKTSTLQTIKTSTASGSNNYLVVEQPKQGRPHSLSSRNHLNSLGSSEDLLSGKSSIASDVGDFSFCNSSVVQDKRTLPTPRKLGIKTTQLKPPSSVPVRRNTSSSSSSLSSMNSSFNSSLSTSPNRVKTSVGAKASLNNSRLSLSTSKISVVRPMSVSSMPTSHFDESGKRQQSTSVTKRKSSVNVPKYKASLTSETSSGGIWRENPEPNPQKSSQKCVLGNIRANSCSKLNTKTVLTRSTKEGRDLEKAAAKILQPIKKLSYGNIGSNVAVSPPVKQSEDRTLSNSCSVAKSALRTPASTKHSLLPTPIGRRISGIPTVTPKTMPGSMSSPNLIHVRHVSSGFSKKTLVSGSERAKNKTQLTSSSSSEGDSSPPQVAPIALDFSPEQVSIEIVQDLAEVQKSAEEMQVKEGLLIDTGINKTPIAIQECEIKPLIDLFNTPEIKVPLMKPTEQLIDLSSPLIGLSPEGNKENLHSPLLRF